MNQSDNINDHELTLKEIVLVVKVYLDYFMSKKFLIIGFLILGIFIGALISYNSEPNYTGKLSFIVEEDEGGGIASGISTTLATFGFGGLKGGKYNYDKIKSIAQSKRVVYKSLLDTMRHKDTLIVNKFLDLYSWNEVIFKSEAKQDLRINSSCFDSLSLTESIILNNVYNHILKNGLLTLNYGEDSKIISLNVTSHDPDLSLSLGKSLYENLSKFYYYQATKGSIINIEELESRLDSLGSALKDKEYALAESQNRNNNIISASNLLRQNKLLREVNMLKISYQEVLRNYETSKFLLQTAQPVFTIIDDLRLPLDYSKRGYFKTMLIGGFLSFILILIILFLGKVYVEIMSQS